MDPLRLDPGSTPEPRDHLEWLVAGLPGEWHVEGAGPTWRAEQHADGVVRAVGLADTVEGRLVSWRVDPEVSDRAALAVLAGAIAAAVVAIAALAALGHQGWGMLVSAPALLVTLNLGRRRVRASLPPTAPHEAALGEAIARRVAQAGSGSSGAG